MASKGDDVPPLATRPGPSWARGVAGLVLGWCLVVLGVVLMPLPGPGTLVVVSGLRVLVPHHRWAAAAYARLRERALIAAALGVATWTRVLGSLAGVGWVGAVAVVYAFDVQFQPFEILGRTIGPGVPFHSVGSVIGLAASTAASAVLLFWTVVRWGPHRTPEALAGTLPDGGEDVSTGLGVARPDAPESIEATTPPDRVAPLPLSTTRCGRSARSKSRIKSRGARAGPCSPR